MKKPFYVIAGIVAAFAVIVAAAFSLTSPPETKKAISESIPYGSNERPISK